MRILESIWLFVDVSEGLVVILEGFVLLLGELLHPSIPFFLYFVESLVNLSFDLSLFAGVIILLSLSLTFGDFSAGRGRRGG